MLRYGVRTWGQLIQQLLAPGWQEPRTLLTRAQPGWAMQPPGVCQTFQCQQRSHQSLWDSSFLTGGITPHTLLQKSLIQPAWGWLPVPVMQHHCSTCFFFPSLNLTLSITSSFSAFCPSGSVFHPTTGWRGVSERLARAWFLAGVSPPQTVSKAGLFPYPFASLAIQHLPTRLK